MIDMNPVLKVTGLSKDFPLGANHKQTMRALNHQCAYSFEDI